MGVQCWGGVLKADMGLGCDPTFQRGRRHMKNKFCMNCNGKGGSLTIDSARVRGLPTSHDSILLNSSEGGVWSNSSALGDDSIKFRVVNNTAGCRPPRLIIFESPPPDNLPSVPWEPVPAEWINGSLVHLYVSRGTLVPVADKKRSRVLAAAAASVVSEADGVQLYLDSHNATGYMGIHVTLDGRVFEARASDGRVLDTCTTVVEAAVAYARHRGPKTSKKRSWEAAVGGSSTHNEEGTNGAGHMLA